MLGSRSTVPALMVLVGLAGWGCRPDGSAHTLSTIPITTVPDLEWIPVQNPTFDHDRQPPDTLFLAETLADTLPIGFVTAIAIVGDYIVVADQFEDPKIAILDRRTGELVRRTGQQGRGPGEFLVPHSFSVLSHEPPRVWVYDFAARRMTLLALERPGDQILADELVMRVGAQLTTLVWTERSIVANGLLLDHTLLILDHAGQPRARIAGRPPYGADAVQDPIARVLLNYSLLSAMPPTNSRFALAYRHSNRLDFFDLDGRRTGSIQGPRRIQVRYGFDPASGRFAFRRDNERAYVSLASTSQYVYALYCGSCSKDMAPRSLHIFAWDGSFVGEVAVVPPVWSIAVSEDDGVLVGSYYDENGVAGLARGSYRRALRP